ncbi:LuxR C-terminal-related transcriptional regulator [Nonomuraea insulae]|uniref:LuxR C-terminal-related transcriptional regulator n=1 Tax=Nonomuraea insulae TaxID=1616787 RepID=A0ABW1CLB6_9ACTN
MIELLYGGAAPKQIARRLDVSPHTVNDHLRAVFRKPAPAAGTSSWPPSPPDLPASSEPRLDLDTVTRSSLLPRRWSR